MSAVMSENRGKKLPIHLKSAHQRLLVKNGRVVNSDRVFSADVYVEDGLIKQVGHNLITPGGARIIDATGCYVIPGGIDLNLYLGQLDEPKVFHKGTHSAAVGGTTTVIATVAPPSGMSHHEALSRYRQMAETTACCHYALQPKLTGWSDKVREDVSRAWRDLNCSSMVLALSSDSAWQPKEHELEEIFTFCKEENGVIILEIDDDSECITPSTNSETNGNSPHSPSCNKVSAFKSACAIAARVNCPVFVSQLEQQTSVESVSAGRRQGAIIYGGVTSAAIGSDGAVQWFRKGCQVKSDEDLATLLANMLLSDLSCVSTDNRWYYETQDEGGLKRANSVQDRLAVLWEKAVVPGHLDPRHFVAASSTNAAKIFNLYPKKGVVAVGSDADIVIWDSGAERCIEPTTHHADADNILEGVRCQGVPLYVISAGAVCVDQNQLRVVGGAGHYLTTPSGAPEMYLRLSARRNVSSKDQRQGVRHVAVPRPALRSTEPIESNHSASNGVHTRAPPAEGVRHQQESNFKASGEQTDDKVPKRTAVKVHAPPGGRSSGFW